MYHIRHIARGEWHVAADKGEAIAVVKTRADARRTLKELNEGPSLRHWAFVGTGNPYTAPECRTLRLTGQVYGHPNYQDGEEIATSTVISIDGQVVKCKSRTYRLEGPAKEQYEAALRIMGCYDKYKDILEAAP